MLDTNNNVTNDDADADFETAFDELVIATKAIIAAFTAKTGQTITALTPVLTRREPPLFEVDVHLGPNLSEAQLNQITFPAPPTFIKADTIAQLAEVEAN